MRREREAGGGKAGRTGGEVGGVGGEDVKMYGKSLFLLGGRHVVGGGRGLWELWVELWGCFLRCPDSLGNLMESAV